MEFTKEEMLDIVSSVEQEYDKMIKNEKEAEGENLAKNEDANSEKLEKYEYDSEDMEKMYSEMDKNEMKDHYTAIQKAMTKMEMDKMEEKDMDKAEAASEKDKISKEKLALAEKEDKKDKKDKKDEKDKKDKKEDMDKAEAASEKDKISKEKMALSEKEYKGEMMAKTEKLESEITKKDTEIADLKKNAEDSEAFKDEFAKFMKLIGADEKADAPAQKSVTGLDYVAKTENDGSGSDKKEVSVEELSKTEVSEILRKKSADPATKSSDRKIINSYFLENIDKTDISEIKHLLQGE